ncbi:MAG: class B sortase [Lachnospiraceae bacterium]|nr:class B sortase [Lachnospiraceae bacterium]
MNSKTRTDRILNILLIVFTIGLIGCGVAVFLWQKDSRDEDNKLKKLKEEIVIETDSKVSDDEENKKLVGSETEYCTIDGKKIQKKLKSLYEQNSDFIGWITQEDSSIDYPVMQTKDDGEYYLHRGFDKQYSEAGCIFVDKTCDISRPSENIILYGHHMIYDSMFSSLINYDSEEYYQGHKIIEFDTLEGNGTYEVIAAFRTSIPSDEDEDAFRFYNYTDMNKERYDEYIKNCKALTPYEIPLTAEYGDRLVTLATCAYHDKKGRFVVVAKQINNQ